MADPAAKPRRAPGPGASRALAATLRRRAKPGVVLAPAAAEDRTELAVDFLTRLIRRLRPGTLDR